MDARRAEARGSHGPCMYVLLLSLSPGLRLALLRACCAQTSQRYPAHLHIWPTAPSACWSHQPSPGCENLNSAPSEQSPAHTVLPTDVGSHEPGLCSGLCREGSKRRCWLKP